MTSSTKCTPPPGNSVSMVIVLVGVLDFVNLMVTVIVPCKREFVVIQSVSMTRKQFNRGFDSADLDVGLIGNKCLTFLIRILVNQGFDSDGCSFAVVCDLLVGDGNVFSSTKGTWRLDGTEGTASIDMDGEGNYVNGFYMDSDTQLHMGNNGNTVYIRMEEAHGVLVRTGRYTGLTETARYDDYYGGYYYEDRTEDGMTSIVNCGFENDMAAGEPMDTYIERAAMMVSDTEIHSFTAENSRELSTKMTYPIYTASWCTGYNEDTRQWDAMIVLTGSYTYLYAFHAAADHVADMEAERQRIFNDVVLEMYEN